MTDTSKKHAPQHAAAPKKEAAATEEKEAAEEAVETPAGTAHVDQQYATGNTGFLGKPSPVTRQSSGADMVAYKVPGGAEAVAREEAESTEAEGVEEVEEEVHKV